jgi:hypothetical protein
MNRFALAFGLLCAGAPLARAQHDPAGEIRKKMDEISALMRESERLLLELSRVDRLVENQREIVEKLKELENAAPPAGGAEADAREQQRRRLQERQEEVRRKLEELTQGQREKGERLVRSIEELLRSLPRGGQGSAGERKPPGAERAPRERERERFEERKQRPADGSESKEERERTRPGGRKPEDERITPERLRQIEVWIARLPDEEQERILRGDLSHVPPVYRRFLEAYTVERARREGAGTGGGAGK